MSSKANKASITELSNFMLTDAEKERLAASIACESTDIETSIKPFFHAAAEEYVRMLLGQQPIRSPELRAFRLFVLIKHFFKTVPPTSRVCDIFGLNEVQGKNLVRDTVARYRFDLEEITRSGIKTLIKDISEPDESASATVTFTTQAPALVGVMNSYLTSLEGYDAVRLVRGSANSYETSTSSFRALKEHFT